MQGREGTVGEEQLPLKSQAVEPAVGGGGLRSALMVQRGAGDPGIASGKGGSLYVCSCHFRVPF